MAWGERMIDQILTAIVAIVALLAGGKMAWDKWQARPAKVVDGEPLVISRVEPLRNDRATAFASVDSLINHFGEEGNRQGIEAAKAAGKALFDSAGETVE